ncbi:MAG: quinone-dependent dihydroorotate dehydrogenase [Opitutaceae bacterium]|nr:quinone-dependent dihydroorotate dehydrogenase [Cytophagales bacterium]
MYKSLLKPFLFRFQPEKAHHITFDLMKFVTGLPFSKSILKSIYKVNSRKLSKTVAGLHFSNPVGLAAGLDKNALLIDEWESLGFGFVEIGTVTPLPQAGNDQPRLFRLPEDEALINRMGFNNDGMVAIAARLKKRKTKIIVGGNIGKNKVTPNENAVDDYLKCFQALYDCVDYFVVNVSSPNTPNLRELQEKEPLKKLLETLQTENRRQIRSKPIFLKIAPDLTESQLDDIIEIVTETKIAGVIATNTTISRDNLKTNHQRIMEIGMGGLSGKPVKNKSTEVIKYLSNKSKKSFAIIGVGGIHSFEDAKEKMEAGSDLIQLYSGFVYEGPGLVKSILKGFLK